MANPFCILPQHADAFLDKVKSGELAPDKLAKMSSEERRNAFAEIMGDAAAEKVNASFESRLLLKSQQKAITDWIDKAGKLAPETRRDLLSRVDRMQNILDPQTAKPFLADLAKQRLGFGVTQAEAAEITALAKDVADAKKTGDFGQLAKANVAFNEYTGKLKGNDPVSLLQFIPKMARFAALTWPTTIGKLVSAALGRGILTPVEDAIATGISKALPGLAEGAGRYGTSSFKTATEAEAAAQAASWTKGMMDAGRLLMNKPSTLELMHGVTTPHAWYDYPGALHAAMKSTTQWAEYARSLYRRTAESAARGEDIKDMTVQMRNSTEAFKDSQRAIFLQDNAVAKAWNGALKSLEAKNPETGKPSVPKQIGAAAMRTEVPITKVPTNIVGEALTHVHGLPVGAGRAIWAYMKGVEDLKPIERDAIIRQMSKGSVGVALMTLAYFKRDAIQFGGLYEEGEHRKPGEIPAGGVRINGHDLPKPLAHLPIIQAMQLGATIGRVYGRYNPSTHDTEGLQSALIAAGLGLLDEVPIINQPLRDLEALKNKSTRGEVLPGKVADIAVPGAVKWIAKQQDTETRPRNPKGLKQHLEANIPGLRENVPVKHPKY